MYALLIGILLIFMSLIVIMGLYFTFFYNRDKRFYDDVTGLDIRDINNDIKCDIPKKHRMRSHTPLNKDDGSIVELEWADLPKS